MSAFETARDMSVGMWTSIRSRIAKNYPSAATTTSPIATNTYEVAHIQEVASSETWPARRIASSIPASLIQELVLRWFLALLGGVLQTIGRTYQFLIDLSMWDLTWLVPSVGVVVLTFRSRVLLVALLSSTWMELEQDVDTFCRRHFPWASVELPPRPPTLLELLPPNTTTISAQDVEAMSLYADAIQRRINHTRMSKLDSVINAFSKLQLQLTAGQRASKKGKAKKLMPLVNYVRSRRAGAVLKVRTSDKVRRQLVEARQALQAERASHQDTNDFLEHQTNARADAEATIEELRAEAAKDDEGTESVALLKKKLEDLQADFNVLEDSRDTWKETYEALEGQADIGAYRALQEQLTSDNAHNERRIGALETSLGFERTNREEAQAIVQDLRKANRELQGALDDANYAYDEVDVMHEVEMRAKEEKADELTSLKADYDRLQAELEDLKACRDAPPAGEKEAAEAAPAEGQRERAHHGDNFDPLYDVSECGDDEEEDRRDHDEDPKDGSNGGAEPSLHGATSSLNGSAPEFVPSYVASTGQPTVSLDTALPSHSSSGAVEDSSDIFGIPDYDFSGSFTEDYELPDNTAGLEFLQSLQLDYSVDAVIEDPFHGEDPFPEIVIPDPTPAPRAAGPGQTRNPHVQQLNQEVKRRDWRKKSGMADSAEEEEGVAGPEDVLDDMYDRQVAQTLNFSPPRYARGSMFGALNDVPSLVITPASSTPSGSNAKSPHTPSNMEEETSTGMPMLDNDEVTRSDPPASGSSGAPKEEENAEADGGSADTEEGDKDEEGKEREGKEGAKPEEDGREEPKAVQQQIQEPASRSQANYWAGIENATKTYDEEVGDAIADSLADWARQSGLKTLSESMWAEKSDAPAKAKPQQTQSLPAAKARTSEEPRQEQPDRRLQRPSSLPSGPKAKPQQTQSSPATKAPTSEESRREQPDRRLQRPSSFLSGLKTVALPQSLTGSMWAKSVGPSPKAKDPQAPQNLSSPPKQGDTSRGKQPEAKDPEATWDEQAASRRPSNFFPGMEHATKTHDEEVGDALMDFIRERAGRSTPLSGSMWADKSDAPSKAKAPQASSTAAGAAPSPRTPTQPGAATAETVQAPTGPRTTPAGTGVGTSIWSSPRSNRGDRGNPRARGPRIQPMNPSPRDPPPSLSPSSGPMNPTTAGGNDTRAPGGFNHRSQPGGRGHPARGGLVTPTPSPALSGPPRGPRSSNAASDSFRRLQERMTRDAEEARKR